MKPPACKFPSAWSSSVAFLDLDQFTAPHSSSWLAMQHGGVPKPEATYLIASRDIVNGRSAKTRTDLQIGGMVIICVKELKRLGGLNVHLSRSTLNCLAIFYGPLPS